MARTHRIVAIMIVLSIPTSRFGFRSFGMVASG
ncbi:Protein of unknown function [Bacillus mycoides]|nr:Protein of unknown function [Bacillus mycoides]